jgi:hypothetical protein
VAIAGQSMLSGTFLGSGAKHIMLPLLSRSSSMTSGESMKL